MKFYKISESELNYLFNVAKNLYLSNGKFKDPFEDTQSLAFDITKVISIVKEYEINNS